MRRRLSQRASPRRGLISIRKNPLSPTGDGLPSPSARPFAASGFIRYRVAMRNCENAVGQIFPQAAHFPSLYDGRGQLAACKVHIGS